jgi:glycosyltransferase involved in cell wall biosynthesis
MRVWLIKEGEYLPVQAGSRRMRCWLMADALRERGHDVIWWHSTFSHQGKCLVAERDQDLQVGPGFLLRLTHAGTYRKNFSFRRYCHGKLLARRFARRVVEEERPDLIVCAFPPIDIAYEAVAYANSRGIPVIIDVQDIWPDAILRKMPSLLRPLAGAFLKRDSSRTRAFLKGADAIVAVSPGFLRRSLGYAGREGSELDQVVYLGYQSPRGSAGEYCPGVRELLSASSGKVVFTYIGSFGLSYELGLICEVAARLLSQNEDRVHFAIAGSGEQYASIAKRVREMPNVTLLGWLNEVELQQLLSVSDVGLVPCISDLDTMPNKPFEYFSHGLPVLSSLEGDMERLIEEHCLGFSYRHGDLETFYALVRRLADSGSLRSACGASAQRLFREKFRAEAIYPEFARYAEQVARKGEDPHA